MTFDLELRLRDKIEKLEEENAKLRKKLASYQKETSTCYGCGETIDGPGHGDCERNW